MNLPKIELTQDGSHTLIHSEFNAHYHSTAGAIEESDFIYINAGLFHIKEKLNLEEVSVLEMGFGTGLNAFNTFIQSQKGDFKVNYVAVEKYPLAEKIVESLNYVSQLNAEMFKTEFLKLHSVTTEKTHEILPNFNFLKKHIDFFEVDFTNQFHVIYFDAFSPNEQPELWTVKLFALMYKALKKDGILVTYCSQGNAKRALREVGFIVKRLPGPPSKRHILRAIKT